MEKFIHTVIEKSNRAIAPIVVIMSLIVANMMLVPMIKNNIPEMLHYELLIIFMVMIIGLLIKFSFGFRTFLNDGILMSLGCAAFTLVLSILTHGEKQLLIVVISLIVLSLASICALRIAALHK